MGHVPAIPESTRDSITWRLILHAEKDWPQLDKVQVTCRGAFAYAAGILPGGQVIPLFRLRYGGSAHSFGFAIYTAARERYEDALLLTGYPTGTPQEALDTACTVHLAGLGHEPDSEPATNLWVHPLSVSPDKLIGAVACLIAACGGLAKGHGEAAAQMVARARSGWSVPAWLDQRLSLVESRAYVAADDTSAAAAAAERAGGSSSPEAAAALAHAWLAAGDGKNARLMLASALAARSGEPERVRVQAGLADARLSYYGGDRVRGRQSLAHALRLAEREQLRLPFVLEQDWIGPVLRCDPELSGIHQRLFPSAQLHDRPPAPSGLSPEATVLVVEPLTEREREVLRHVAGMLNTAEIASEMYISINTVKAHLKSSYRKLAATHRGEAVRRARQLELI